MDQNNFIYVYMILTFTFYMLWERARAWETSVTVNCVQRGLIIVPNEH